MLFTSLRLGFVVLPESFVDAFAAARYVTDRHSPTLEQAVLAEFILEGYFGHHIRHMRQVYAERCQVLVEAAKGSLSGKLDVPMAASGMRTVGWLKTREEDSRVAARARAAGLEVIALSQFARRNPQPGGLLLGFGASPPSELRRRRCPRIHSVTSPNQEVTKRADRVPPIPPLDKSRQRMMQNIAAAGYYGLPCHGFR